MVIYILKFSACLLLFIGFYKVFLERESFHKLKRYYLLGAIVLALCIPFVTFTTYIEAPISEEIANIVSSSQANIETTQATIWKDNLPMILWTLYAAGFFLFAFRFIKHLNQLYAKIKTNQKLRDHYFTNVLLKDNISPHTFFKYIFLNKYKFENQLIPKEVLLHEQTHAIQLHAIDILCVEIIHIFFWFNPLIYIIKKDIKLNHEFLADQSVLDGGIQPSAYQELLLAFSSNASESKLANAINYSLIKKRFTVMKTKTTKRIMMLKTILILPLLAVTLYSFSSRTVVEVLPENDISILPEYNDIESQEQKQKGASREQMREYNELAKYYNSMSKDNMKVKQKDVERMKYIYSLMSEKQRQDAEPFPKIPKAPPAPDAPKVKKPDLPPPPPPLPDNASPEAKAKYEQEMKKYKEKALKAEKKAYKEKEKPKKAKKEKNKQVYVKEQMAKERAVLAELRMAERVKRTEERELVLKEQKAELAELRKAEKGQRAEKRELELKAQKAELALIKEKHASEREAAIVELKEVRMAERAKIVEERKMRAQEAKLARVKEVHGAETNREHIKRMNENNAEFYFEGKKISFEKALDLVTENPKLNVQTRKDHNSGVNVYISKKPIKIKADN